MAQSIMETRRLSAKHFVNVFRSFLSVAAAAAESKYYFIEFFAVFFVFLLGFYAWNNLV